MVTFEKETMVRVIPQIEVLKMIERVVEKHPVEVSVEEVVGLSMLGPKKGLRLAKYVLPFLQQNRKVAISVKGVLMLLHWFLDPFYVYLYKNLPKEVVDNNLTFTDLKGANDITIKDSSEEAKIYVFDRPRYDQYHKDMVDYMVCYGYMSEEAAASFRDFDEREIEMGEF